MPAIIIDHRSNAVMMLTAATQRCLLAAELAWYRRLVAPAFTHCKASYSSADRVEER